MPSLWNHLAIMSTSRYMFTSGLAATILEISLSKTSVEDVITLLNSKTWMSEDPHFFLSSRLEVIFDMVMKCPFCASLRRQRCRYDVMPREVTCCYRHNIAPSCRGFIYGQSPRYISRKEYTPNLLRGYVPPWSTQGLTLISNRVTRTV